MADGVPVWPDEWLGSISHSKGVVGALVAPVPHCQLLGFDLEHTDRLSPAAMARVVHPAERSWVAGNQQRASLLFSLKEAFYKAQFQRWRQPANFHDLALVVDEALRSARVQWIGDCFADELRGAVEQLNFRYALNGKMALSMCWLRGSGTTAARSDC